MANNKRRVSLGTILIILLALAILLGLGIGWARCGLGQGDEDDKGGQVRPAADVPAETVATSDAAPPSCILSVASDGAILADDGVKLSVDEAVARCRGGRTATLQVAGNAPFGAVDDLRKALEAAGLEVREP